MDLPHEVARRRTFAIISHPDAGKTTLTEKLLLYGGSVHIAGAVKSRKAARHALSDFMAMEREKGISISTSVLQFEHEGLRMNLLDTPGHADFSEDTYRTLAAVDSAIMLIDVAKGVEPRTLKLFEVCRLRKLPVITFVNKMDRSGLEPLELMDQVGNTLGIRTVALNWPIWHAHEFVGVYDRLREKAVLWTRLDGTSIVPEQMYDLDDPALEARVGTQELETLREELEMLDIAGDPWSLDAFLSGDVTPFFFGSAMINFGVSLLLEALGSLAPPPSSRPTVEGSRHPSDEDFSGFIFKIQANMDARHRDRIAFMRVVSGQFERGMDVKRAAGERAIRLSKPHTFLASERSIVDIAVPGDIVGLYDPGDLRLGDTLYQGERVEFQGIPRFAPEFFARVRLKDPTKRKHLQRGLEQLSQEGTVQLFYRPGEGKADPFVGAVGLLQFEVLKSRLASEYNTQAELDAAPFSLARWVVGDEKAMAWLGARPDFTLVEDRTGHPVVLAASPWALTYATREVKGLELFEISPL
ncbi:MAG: peptide chain release factor 3 [Deltaproteobacteria bacterium]|nr:peptide chain release factor 3 [Deltaproteobacteria bacterium]